MDALDSAVNAGRGRRRHSIEFKERVVPACCLPGVSDRAVSQPMAPSAHDGEGKFLPVKLDESHAPMADIRIKLLRGQSTASRGDRATCAD